MSTPELDVIKDVPGYKVILKAVLKSQIQQLVEQLAAHTDEESVILTASVSDGTLSHLGSDSGKSFLGDHEDIKSQFLGFCLRRHHKQKQLEKERQEKEEAMRNLPMTPSRQMGPRFSPRSPRFPSPRQQGVFPVTLSRAGGPMRSPGARHEPYPRPMKRPSSFDQQGRGPSQSPRMTLSGQVIKIEAEDPDDPEASNNSNILSGDSGPGSPSQANVDTNQSAPSLKTETSDREEDAKSSSSASTIPNEAADLKLSLDSDLSSLLPTVEGGDNEQSGAPSTPQTTGSGMDPNVNVKVEALTEAEMELEITGVELGPQPGTSQESWGPNVPGGAMGYSPQGATGNQSDIHSQGYNGEHGIPNSYELSGFCIGKTTPSEGLLNLPSAAKLCTFCGKWFGSRWEIDRHMTVHTGAKPFACEFCDFRSARKDNLKIHIHRRHKHMIE